MNSFDVLVSDAFAAAAAMTGWDFGYLRDRTSGEELSWSYDELARVAVARSTSVLDLDTGGGELLASLQPPPQHTVAVEGWEPNLAVARKRLRPLGVDVRQDVGEQLPVGDGEFDLILSRHGRIAAGEVCRALSSGGRFLTQQVGSRNDLELVTALGSEPSYDPDSSSLAKAVADLRAHGFEIVDAREEFPAYRFHDIAAVVYQLSVVSWTIPDFDIQRYDAPLRELDARIRTDGPLVTHNHRYLIDATKPT